jgi:hypothetical protein
MKAPALLSINPELQRGLWLELTQSRLLAAPLVLFLVIGGVAAIGAHEFAARLARFAIWVLLTAWGGRLAAESFSDEVAAHTWDGQRLSAEPPWRLTLGKLFGGTAFVWYAAAICGVCLILLRAPGWGTTLAEGALGGVTAQAAALFTVLLLHRFDGDQGRGHVALAQIVGIVAAWKSGLLALPIEIPATFSASIRWYGVDFPGGAFLTAIQILSVLWLIFGSIRIVRRELGFVDGPLGWSLYMVYALILTAGLMPPSLASPRISAGWFHFNLPLGLLGLDSLTGVAAMTLTYLALFFTPISRVSLRKLANAFAAGDWRAAWRDLPPWVPSIVALAAVAVTLSLRLAAWEPTRGGALIPLAAVGFVARDIALVIWLRLTYRHRSAMAIFIMVFMLYAALPFVLGALSFGVTGPLFYPGLEPGPTGLIAPWVEAAVAGLAVRRLLRV